MDFEEFRKTTAGVIEKELEHLLKDWREEESRVDSKLLPLVDKFIGSCKGGKRLRGVLVVLGYEIGKQSSVGSLKSSDNSQNLKAESETILKTDGSIVKVAAAYEIFHSAILAHDDIIDQSILRRGQPSLYIALGGNHFGASQAICLGDAGFFLAQRIISESSFKDKQKVEALSWFNKTMLDTAIGEMLDIMGADAITTAKFKTAKYSICGPLILGAILAGANQKLINILEEFGESLGIAFQIKDDILGVFGSEDILGKSVTSDTEEGKNTLLFSFATLKASPDQKKILDTFYGKGKIKTSQFGKIKQIFAETGALNYTENEIKKYKDKALKILPQLTKDKGMSKLLEQLAESLIERRK